MEINKANIERINHMDLSPDFRDFFDKLVYNLEQKNDPRCWDLANTLYNWAKLEDLSDKDIKFLRDFMKSV